MKGIVFIILFLLVGAVSANQTIIIDSPQGAGVRLTQLKIAVDANIAAGEKILEYRGSRDVTDLEAILYEMRLLSMEIEDEPYGLTQKDLVNHFMELKYDAVKLTDDFRLNSKFTFEPALKKNISDAANQAKNQVKKMNQEKLVNVKNHYNEYRLNEVAKYMGFNSNQLYSIYKNESMTLDKMKLALRNRYQQMSDEMKFDAIDSLSEENEKRNIFIKSVEEEFSFDRRGKELVRAKNRLLRSRYLTIPDNVKAKMVRRVEMKNPVVVRTPGESEYVKDEIHIDIAANRRRG